MLMYYKYDEFSMYKAMGAVAKNEEIWLYNIHNLAYTLHLQK